MALKRPNGRTLVIAFGNPLRQDDGIGFHAAELLGHSSGNGDMQVIFRQQLTPDLAASIAEAERIIFIDADTGPPPGSISVRNLKPETFISSCLFHHITPGEIIAFANKIYGRTPRTHQVTVSGAAFDFKEGLTPSVKSALPVLVEIVKNLCDS
jgi:hydrogenase maturation protease